MVINKIVTLLLCALFSTTALAAENSSIANFFASISGTWKSDQDVFGKPSNTILRLSPALDGQFVHLEYSIEALEEESSFLGAAYYKQSNSNSTTGHWFSNQGEVLPIKTTVEFASIDGVARMMMNSEWGERGKTFGKTTYTLLTDEELEITDWIHRDGNWHQFNSNLLNKLPHLNSIKNQKPDIQKVTGIGGLFFRAKESSTTANWYAKNLGIDLTPKDYDTAPWQQEAGPTVFAPFSETTTYFGNNSQQWMVNFRVTDLDAIVIQLRANGNKVDVDEEQYPNGRFARTYDPEGNPVELWEPQE